MKQVIKIYRQQGMEGFNEYLKEYFSKDGHEYCVEYNKRTHGLLPPELLQYFQSLSFLTDINRVLHLTEQEQITSLRDKIREAEIDAGLIDFDITLCEMELLEQNEEYIRYKDLCKDLINLYKSNNIDTLAEKYRVDDSAIQNGILNKNTISTTIQTQCNSYLINLKENNGFIRLQKLKKQLKDKQNSLEKYKKQLEDLEITYEKIQDVQLKLSLLMPALQQNLPKDPTQRQQMQPINIARQRHLEILEQKQMQQILTPLASSCVSNSTSPSQPQPYISGLSTAPTFNDLEV